MRHDGVIDTIGRTPLVRLDVPAPAGVAAYAKLECQNLGAMKDRVARQIILAARERGDLAPGVPIVESSSGTMALGVALVGTSLGHPVHIVTDPRIDDITLAKLRAFGCAVHVVPEMDEHGWQGARLRRLAELIDENPGAFWPRQYENPDNPAAYRTLAEEILADLDGIDDHLDVLVGSVGSGGSLCGTARVLRETYPDLRVVAVDCVGSVLFDQPDWPQRAQSGLGNSLHPRNLDRSLIDEVHWLSDREAFTATRALAAEQKLFCGNTSGSVYRILTWLAASAPEGTRLAGIFPDRGDRYVDSVYADRYWEERGITAQPLADRPRQVVAGTPVRSWSYVDTRPDGSPPALVFVESNTTGSGMHALGVARRLGFLPVLAVNDPGRYRGVPDHCRVVHCDTDDPAALYAAVTAVRPAERIAGVTTTSEFYAVAAAGLAHRLGRPAERPDVLAGCRDKGALRQTLAAAGVRQPRFAVVADADAAVAAAREVGLPCVVKPVDDSGSRNVLWCADATAVAEHAAAVLAVDRNVRGQPTARRVLVEEYLDGPEYSVEMFAVDGRPVLLDVVEKSVTGHPNFVEWRHVLPAGLPDDVRREVVDTVAAAIAAVGLRHGPSHTEVRLTPAGAAIIEINPRLAGGMIPELFRLTTGVDLLESQIRVAAGLPPELPAAADGYAGIQFLLPPDGGVLDGADGAAAGAVPGVERVVLTAVAGRRLAAARDAYDRLGYVIARGPSRAAVTGSLARATELVDLHVRPEVAAL